MTEKIKVASRAVRRGRRLRSRSQRPPAPSLSRSGREELESSHDEVCDSEASPATPKYYSRPPAPVAFFDADEPQDAHEDTFDETVDSELRSGPSTLRGGGSTDSQAVAPEVAIIEAQDEEGKEMDASFFKTESLAPVAYGAEDEEEAESSTDDEQVWLSRGERARRDRLRRIVGGIVAAAAVVMVSFGIKASLQAEPQAAEQQAKGPSLAAPAPAAPALAPADETKAKATPVLAGGSGTVVKMDAEEPEELEDATVESADEDGDDELSSEKADELSIDELRSEVVGLLNRAKFEEAIPLAKTLIERDDESAFGYRCLGAAYQDLGRIKDARRIYDACVKTARKGRVIECSQLGGRIR